RGQDQVAPQRRWVARRHELRARRAPAQPVQGRGARRRRAARPARRHRVAPAVPGPRPGRAHHRHGHARAAADPAGGRRHRHRGDQAGRSLPRGVAELRRAAGGEDGRRDGRRAHVRVPHRGAGRHQRRRHDRRLGAHPLRRAGATVEPHHQRGAGCEPGRSRHHVEASRHHRMGVALVVTVRDEASSIFDLLAAIDGQTLAPNEIVIVDGGSSDGTMHELERWSRSRPTATIVSAPGASIPAGRNIAISKTNESVIAVTDAGCIPDRDWLYHLVAALDDPAVEVAMGFYRAAPRSRFERLVDCLNLPDVEEVDPEKFMPSSRSIAFRRYVWEQVGGYPEWLPVGEDQWFDHRIVEAQYRRRFVPEAVVRWRLRPDLRSFVRQYYRYAWGDGASGMYPRRHAL